MSAPVQALLDAFEALSEAEQHEVIVEVLRRAGRETAEDLPEDVLLTSADRLFLELDEREEADAHPESR
jgi:hypothetical protein